MKKGVSLTYDHDLLLTNLDSQSSYLKQYGIKKLEDFATYSEICPRASREELILGNDLIELRDYSNPNIIECIYTRYWLKNIYTFCGSSLISINPFDSRLPLYNLKIQEKYKKLLDNPVFVLNSIKPHLYSIAINSLHLAKYRKEETESSISSICLSGQSGSGKTFTVEKLNEFIAYCFQTSVKTESSLIYKVTTILKLDFSDTHFFRFFRLCTN